MVRRRGAVRVLRDGSWAGLAGAVTGGIPSTLHAVLTRGDPLAATAAAGSVLLPAEHRRGALVASGGLVHVAVSAAWGVVLAAVLPRRAGVAQGVAGGVAEGVVAGLAIAAVDLRVVGRRLERFRAVAALPFAPQLADHVAYGVTVTAVLRALARRRTGAEAGTDGAAGRRGGAGTVGP